MKQPVTRPQRIRHWFYNHAKLSKTPPPLSAPPLELSTKPPRKLVRITLAQAYSCLFCQKGTPLHTELRSAWKLYKSADKDTLDKYQHLFPRDHNPDMRFVTFQQVLLRDKTTKLDKDELEDLKHFIDTRYEEDKQLRERPWNGLKVHEAQSEVDLEKQYIAR